MWVTSSLSSPQIWPLRPVKNRGIPCGQPFSESVCPISRLKCDQCENEIRFENDLTWLIIYKTQKIAALEASFSIQSVIQGQDVEFEVSKSVTMSWSWILLVNMLGGVHSSQRIETLKKKAITNPAITAAAYKWHIWFLVDWSVHCRLIWDLPSHPVPGSKLERKRSHTCGISMASTFIGYSLLPIILYFFLYYFSINFYRLLPSCQSLWTSFVIHWHQLL